MVSIKNITFLYIGTLLLCGYHSFGQSIKVDQGAFKIEIIHARKLKKVQASTNVILLSDELKTVFVKLRMSTTDEERHYFDINKFSLLEDENKLRIRPMSISYQEFTAYMGFDRLSFELLDFKSFDIKYKPELKDSFNDFRFEGYSVMEIPMNYGGLRKPKNYVSYYKPQKFKSKKLNFFFSFPRDCKKGTLYYGEEKIAILRFK